MPKLTRTTPRDISQEDVLRFRKDAQERRLKRDLAAERRKQELTDNTYNSLDDLYKLQVVNTLLLNKITEEASLVAVDTGFDAKTEREAAIHRTRIINLKDLLAVERGIRDLASRVAVDGMQSHTIGAGVSDEGQLALDQAELTLTKMGVILKPIPMRDLMPR